VRAVLDPNVLISALLSPNGVPAQLVSRWLEGDFELVVSERLLAELNRALRYPKLRDRIRRPEAAAFVALLEATGVVASDVSRPPRRSADPGDDYLVSGDAHLVELADRLPVRSPRAFLEMLD